MFSNERAILHVDNPTLAVPLMQWLTENGIAASLADPDDMGGMNPGLAFAHGSAIVVPADQVQRAEELIDQFEDETLPDDDGEPAA